MYSVGTNIALLSSLLTGELKGPVTEILLVWCYSENYSEIV